MALELPHGSYALRVLLFIRPAAASKAKRDATPLRLISWLSYKLNPELEHFIEKAMEHLSTWTETEGGKVLTMGKEAIPRGGTVDSEEELRNELIELISVGNLKYKPQALFYLVPAIFDQDILAEADPLHGPGPPPAHARTSGLGGRGKNPVELSLYPMVTRAALRCHPTGANLLFLLLP